MGAPVILITGALTGIGRATAFAFAKEGATVVASGRREAEGKALEAELHSLGVEAAFILADVRHEDEVRNLVEQTVARFAAWMSRSTMPAPKENLAHWPSRRPRAMQGCSTP